MFIPTWRGFPCAAGGGTRPDTTDTSGGDSVPWSTHVPVGTSQPQGQPSEQRDTAAVCEGRGFSKAVEGRGDLPAWPGLPLELCWDPLPGARSCCRTPGEVWSSPLGPVLVSRGRGMAQEEFMLSHCRKMRNTLQDFSERLCKRDGNKATARGQGTGATTTGKGHREKLQQKKNPSKRSQLAARTAVCSLFS